MKNDVKLFINNELVDFSNELSMPFVYQLEDTNNPSIVKNSFTKTINIVGTKQNNKIFGDIYNFDREQLYSPEYVTGAYFNPSFRTPFSIYNNGELIESGYMQLNSITLKNKIINYQITLYGGIGDMFYSLSYNEDNEPLTLSDLTFGVKDDNGKTLNPENEFDFTLTKDTVKKCWDNIESTDTGKLENYITFVPCLNGIYEDFDNNKAVINVRDCKAFPQTSTTVDDKTYLAVNGYALAEFEDELTEWETKNLISFHQRPAIKLKKVIEACCNPINNNGYKIDLDPTFFNENNPYWENSYIALPMLERTFDKEGGSATSTGCTSKVLGGYTYVGENNGVYVQEINYSVLPQGNEWKLNNYDGIDVSDFNFNTTFNADIDIQLFFKSNTTKKLYQSILVNGTSGGITHNNYPIYQSITAQILVYGDGSPVPVATSDIYNFTNKLPNGNFSNPTNWGNWYNWFNSPVVNIFGSFVYDSNSGKHYFKSDEDSNTFRLSIKNVERYNDLQFVLVIRKESSDGVGINNSRMWTSEYGTAGNLESVKANGYWTGSIMPESIISATWDIVEIGGKINVTKKLLLKTEKSPADYLLSYTKLFNLYFKKDIGNKKVSILTRNNYFKDEVVDWSHRIDWSQDVQINPILFDKKFYAMDLDNPDNYYLNKYKNDYSVSYGQKRINTAYNFNNETQQLFNGNVFEKSISVLDNSIYYRSFYNTNGVSVPAFGVEGLTMKLFTLENNNYVSTDIDIHPMADMTKTINWNKNSGYDAIVKPAFFNMDDNKKTLSDINATLLFFNGYKTPKDVNGSVINYWLSDYISIMDTLNNGKACYLYTESEYDLLGNKVAVKLSSIPQFLNYNIENNTVINSWDFAVPKESYIPNLTYNDNTTIYNRFWSSFYEDQLNINTKKITCNVNLEGLVVNDELLRKFYWFGNSIWILNKIQDYDINKYGTTKCEFIKVQEQYSYLKPIGF